MGWEVGHVSGSGRAGTYFSRKATRVGPSDADLGLVGGRGVHVEQKGPLGMWAQFREEDAGQCATAAWEGMDLTMSHAGTEVSQEDMGN